MAKKKQKRTIKILKNRFDPKRIEKKEIKGDEYFYKSYSKFHN